MSVAFLICSTVGEEVGSIVWFASGVVPFGAIVGTYVGNEVSFRVMFGAKLG